MMRMSVPFSSRWVAKLCRGVDGDALGEVRGGASRAAGRVQHGRMDRMTAVPAREQPLYWPGHSPVCPQDVEQLRREHHVAVTAALALLDANDHPAAVDVGKLEA